MAVVRPEAIDLHPQGRNEMEGGRPRLSWTARNGAQRQGKKVGDGRCGDKIESPRSGIGLRSDQPLSRTQMGAPVAKIYGMKTGGPNPFDHSDLRQGAWQQNAAYLKYGHLDERVIARKWTSSLSAISTHLSKSPSQDRRRGMATYPPCGCNLVRRVHSPPARRQEILASTRKLAADSVARAWATMVMLRSLALVQAHPGA